MATAAELSDELERTRTRLAAVTAAGDAMAHLLRTYLERGGLAVTGSDVRPALEMWRDVRPI